MFPLVKLGKEHGSVSIYHTSKEFLWDVTRRFCLERTFLTDLTTRFSGKITTMKTKPQENASGNSDWFTPKCILSKKRPHGIETILANREGSMVLF